MSDNRIQFSTVVQNQLPSYVRQEFPLVADFLSQYYLAQEFKGAPLDLIQNIDQYIKLDKTTTTVDSEYLYADIDVDDTTIEIDLLKSTSGTANFPDSYGLLKIGNEIITYTGKTVNSFTGCIRGFSGINSLDNELEFSETEAESHVAGSTIENLSDLFLKQFLLKTKVQLIPGLESRELDSNLNQNIFIKQAKDFYSSKGTDESFRILFKALYNEKVDIVRPKEYLVRPSDANFRVTNDFIVESVSGNPYDLENLTLIQNEYGDIAPAYGPVAYVEKISTNDASDYYALRIDAGYNRDINYKGSVYGDFSIHAKTRVIGNVSAGTSTFEVDSTVGFPQSGELYVTYDGGVSGIVSYTSKNITQFIGCSNVTSTINDATYVGINTYAFATTGFGTEVSVRMTSVLDSLTLDPDSYFYNKGDSVTIKSLGSESDDIKFNNWILNISASYKVDKITTINASSKIYELEFDKKHLLYTNDSLELTDEASIKYDATITDVRTDKKVVVKSTSTLTSNEYTAKRNLKKSTFTNHPTANIFTTDVQNTYVDEEKALIASPSLPSYDQAPIETENRVITLSGPFVGDTFTLTTLSDHGYYTGDEIYYSPEKISIFRANASGITTSYLANASALFDEGLYFVKRLNSTQVKLAKSRSDIDNEKFITLDTTKVVTRNTIIPFSFYGKNLISQQLLREIKTTETSGKTYETLPGKTGILVNGVEIANYKSRDVLYYGPINEVDVTAPGNGYDIINPPEVAISDRSGTGCTAHAAIIGSLERIDIIDPGFDYQEDPVVNITGGNGVGAEAQAHTTLLTHSISFNSELAAARVSLGATLSTIGFSTYHKFREAEQIIYKTDGQTAVGGLSTGAVYNVGVQDSFTIKLYKSEADVLSGINTVTLSSYGIGNHSLESVNKKKIVDSITVSSSGTGYENKKRTCFSVGINTALNYINIKNHDYQSGEIVKYSSNETPVSGISTNTEYYVTKVDDDNFLLSQTGPSDDKQFYYRTRQYLNLTNKGEGLHSFNYPEISVQLIGNIGISSIGTETFEAQFRPIFRGSIESIHLSANGSSYGSEETLNYQRQPNFEINQGRNAEFTPIVNNGQIVEVLVNNVGADYTSAPDLILSGIGTGAAFTPIITNNQIIEVKVINKGFGYTQATTTLVVSNPGDGFKADAKINRWNVNNFQKNIDNFSSDDGFITESINPNMELEYTHLYAPRKLREKIYPINQDGDFLYSKKDITKLGNIEIASSDHSPIIGWAYDGNPIYGPYAYRRRDGGNITQMKSGYKIDLKSNRPATSIFPEGFFIEDYTHFEVDDDSVLDENNGRFCITPDFPKGTYAYFATVNNISAESKGNFVNYRKPEFPYLIGNSFRSKPNQFNFESYSNQNEIDLNHTDWKRNVEYYNLKYGNFYYDYIDLPNDLEQTFTIQSTFQGNVQGVGIATGGQGYRVGDRVVFDNLNADGNSIGFGAAARVSEIEGKEVNSISVASTVFYNTEFYPGPQKGDYVLYFDEPHNLQNVDIVNIAGLSTSSSRLEGSYTAGISSAAFFLTGVGSSTLGLDSVSNTGIVTFVSVSGNLSFESIRDNDIIQISEEKLKVLNVDEKYSRLRVLREIDGTSGVAHTIGETIYENPRKLTINPGFKSDYQYKINRELYFDPSETVGLGTTAGIGIGHTLSLSNPGTGLTEIFIPTKTLHLPNHGFITGESLIYSPNGGDVLEVSPDGVSTDVVLADQSILYVAKVSDDLIGLSTERVGLNSTGSFVGIATTTSSIGTLFFTGIGTGTYHSFTTRHSVITGEVSRNIVTVSTAQTHGLVNNDYANINVNPGLTTTYSVKYSDYNRVATINERTFSGVNTTNNSIQIDDHGFETGQKVLHTASTPSGGLQDNGTYYVVVFDKNTIKLSNSLFDATSLNPRVVDLTSSSSGAIELINPKLVVYKNSTVVFDLSDSSLSYQFSFTDYPAFDFNLYTDPEYTNLFNTTQVSNTFDVQKSGTIGVDADAKITLNVTDDLPDRLFYKLVPVFNSNIPDAKQEVVVDSTVLAAGEITIRSSKFNGNQQITVNGIKSFTYTLPVVPEEDSYTTGISSITYGTKATSTFGPIRNIKINNKGIGYSNLPKITTVTSAGGTGAILEAISDNIGRPKSVKVNKIGFNFPADYSMRPETILPQIVKVDPLSSFESIGISSFGRGYNIAPKLLVFDGKTNELIPEVDIRYQPGDTSVSILRNTYGINDVTPKILPIENPNGVGISTISYNPTTEQVTVTLSVGFSTADTFPINVNDKVMIENVSVGVGTTVKGYNSSNYNYSLFTIVAVEQNLGGAGATVAYSMSDYLSNPDVPGTFDAFNSAGRIIPEKDFPVFDIALQTNSFLEGETVHTDSVPTGTVDSWDSKNKYLKLLSKYNFVEGELIYGDFSKTQAIPTKVEKFSSSADLNASTVVKNGWQGNVGFLNDELQRVQDGLYYQNFSYSLKSKVDYDTWDNAVSTMNHTAGFKKFSDMQIESRASTTMSVGVGTGSNIEIVADLTGIVDLNCTYDFDLVRENSLVVSSRLFSDEIIFENRILTDYFESVGNRVLNIDDISGLFNSNPRPTRFSAVYRFDLGNIRSQKILTYVRDKRYTDERQFMIVTANNDRSEFYLNQYARVESGPDLGSFDFSVDGTDGILNFYPTKYSINDYDVSVVSYNIFDSLLSIGSTVIGESLVSTSSTVVPTGSTTNLVSLGSTYSSHKVLVQITKDDNEHQFDELNIVSNGTDVELLEFGQLSTDIDPLSITGFGTYYSYIDGSDIKLDFIPSVGVAATVNTIQVSLSDASTSGIGTLALDRITIESRTTSITSSGSPTSHVIGSFSDPDVVAYFIVQVADETNTEYQLSEVVVLNDGTDALITEYANLETAGSLGTIDAQINGATTELTFTPNPSIDAQVKVYMNCIHPEAGDPTAIDFNNATIQNAYGSYTGTESDVKRKFILKHKTYPIFERYFDGTQSSIVDTTQNSVTIPNHFFVTGEKLDYHHAGAGTSQAVSIASTSVPGIGVTDKLPSELYAVKINENTLKFASSAENALKPTPEIFDITSVGIGTSHRFVANKQNAKVIISIDNVIQSPLVSTALTTSLAVELDGLSNLVYFSGITSFFGGDLIQIGSEIMKIEGVGIGSTNAIRVRRPWMGTGIQEHGIGSTITKIDGDYNIVDNDINFVTAPYGNTPLGTSTNPPDERDWTGISTGSSFHGRSFMRSGVSNGSNETYYKNYIFDDISDQFTGSRSDFTLTDSGSNVTGISTENAILLINEVFQGPGVTNDYVIEEAAGISTVSFTGTATSSPYDANSSNLPLGGVIVSVGSEEGFGYQPLISAGGTAIVSGLGTISSISIGNSGSGYRAGIQTVVNVSVATSSTGTPNIELIGTASITDGHIVSVAITNPGSGYTTANPPIVIFDDPLSYSDIPLYYSSSSAGIGTQATVDIVVGQGSSVIDFEIRNTGYSYREGDILTVPTGGTLGIPTSTGFSEFQITVQRVFNDKFSGWSVGELQVLDSIEDLFDGGTVVFPMKISDELIAINSSKGSNIDVEDVLLVFVNDILQVPGEGYEFNGGSLITFTEAPKEGDRCKIIFYKGSGGVDVIERTVLPTVKVGDDLTIGYDSYVGQSASLQEEERVVSEINSTDFVTTNPYFGPGNVADETLTRPVTWCRQTEDRFIDGKEVAKDRVLYEPHINPFAYAVQSVGVGTTVISVDNIRPFFNQINENNVSLSFQDNVTFISQETKVGASATAVVSGLGTITSIVITDGGIGYSTNPSVSIQNPVGLGTTQRAEATASITSGIVTSITVTDGGTGYASTSVPLVLVGPPAFEKESNGVDIYEGDSGIIVGVTTTTVGVPTGIILDLYIPSDSFFRDSGVTGVTTISGISTGYFLTVYNSNVGNGVTSIDSTGADVGIGSTCLDNIYEVVAVSIGQTSAPGIGLTYVAKATVSVTDWNGLSGIGNSNYYGNYSWGRITLTSRTKSKEYNAYTSSGSAGITTGTIVQRTSALKYSNYT